MTALTAYLNRARQKPLAIRQRLAVVWSVGLTLLVVLIWFGLATLATPPSSPASTPPADGQVIDGSFAARVRSGWQILLNKIK